ncbi:hypothetical protein AAFF_G00220670 [Aldrovandia affinis]|uniref:Uncharacterized protein n=1 Tax=Aldrovandia affinis TaxID=143900 RepID=A0AAD7W428_9TELE|nr:hypothetical protein AAFF_G00220670 [Aldrovandia affinis]
MDDNPFTVSQNRIGECTETPQSAARRGRKAARGDYAPGVAALQLHSKEDDDDKGALTGGASTLTADNIKAAQHDDAEVVVSR